MSEKVADGGGFQVISCSRGQPAPALSNCSSCGDEVERVKPCAFQLRGPKAGQTCGMVLCRVCAQKVGKAVMCPAHARLTARSKATP